MPSSTIRSRRRRTPTQIRQTLRVAQAAMGEGRTQRAVCHELGISPSTYRRWKKHYSTAERSPAVPHKPKKRALPTPPRRRQSNFIDGVVAVGMPLINKVQTQIRKYGPQVVAATRQGLLVASDLSKEWATGFQNKVAEAVEKMTLELPKTDEALSKEPAKRSAVIIHTAARKAAAVSGGLTLPGGPLALLTVIPDLVAIWKIQSQMVADIAGTFGKTAALNRDHLLFCLFKHATSQIARDVAIRMGDRALVKRGSSAVLRHALGKVTIPFLGAVVVAGYTYFDTVQVGETAVEIFEKENLESVPA